MQFRFICRKESISAVSILRTSFSPFFAAAGLHYYREQFFYPQASDMWSSAYKTAARPTGGFSHTGITPIPFLSAYNTAVLPAAFLFSQ